MIEAFRKKLNGSKIEMMWQIQGFKVIRPPSSFRRGRLITDREFQARYAFVVVLAAALGTILTIIPIYYLLNQNYELFFNLAYEHTPDLLKNLERERGWINTLLVANFVGVLVFFTFLSFKLTTRIVGPLKVLRNHLRLLSRGYWTQPQIVVRESDEFQELISTYNYFYKSIQVQLTKELQLLKRVRVDFNDRDSFQAWKQLLEERIALLQTEDPSADPKPIFLNGAWLDSPRDPRRAS